jgi:hypothetical protein
VADKSIFALELETVVKIALEAVERALRQPERVA